MRNRKISLVLAFLMCVFTLFGCSDKIEEAKDISIKILSCDVIVYEGLIDNKFKLDVEILNAEDKTIKYVIDSETDDFSIDDFGVVSVSENVENNAWFSVVAVSAQDKTKSDTKVFSIERTEISGSENWGRIPAPVNNGTGYFDDFSAGVDPNKWVISTQRWGGHATANNQFFMGCVTENVSFTEDGILLLKATGNYSASRKREGELSGATIALKEAVGPGSYEVAMKVLPRLGVCNAIWTYYYADSGSINHEIDIELPGHPVPNTAKLPAHPDAQKDTTTGFDRTLFSTWIQEANPKTSAGLITDTPANDGRWHLYRFDWHTSPVPKVDFYIDNVLMYTSYTHIPFYKGHLRIGAWLPKDWCGQPDFEEDYMMVDWFNYTPYLDQPVTDIPENHPPSISYEINENLYPKTPVKMPERDYISNRGFEGVATAWKITNSGLIQTTNVKSGGKSLKLSNGASASQKIEEVFEGFEFDFSGFAKAVSGSGNFQVEYYTFDNKQIGDAVNIAISSSDYSLASKRLIAPAGCNYLLIKANSNGTVYFDDLSLKLVLPYEREAKPMAKEKLEAIEISTNNSLTIGKHKLTSNVTPNGSNERIAYLPKEPLPNGVSLFDGSIVVNSTAKHSEKFTIKAVSRFDSNVFAEKEFTINNPIIQISTESQLKAISDNLFGNYELANDITLTQEFVGIGTADKIIEANNGRVTIQTGEGFSGRLNGNGYTIKNFDFKFAFGSSSSGNGTGFHHGLFNQIENTALIENLGLEGGTKGVEGLGYLGSLVGLNKGTIRNCFSSVSVTAQNHYPSGLLVGDNRGMILNSLAMGRVEIGAGSTHGGGFVGVNDGTINYCYMPNTATDYTFGQFKENITNVYAIKRSESWLKTKKNFIDSNWDENIWQLQDGYYPVLKKLI